MVNRIKNQEWTRVSHQGLWLVQVKASNGSLQTEIQSIRNYILKSMLKTIAQITCPKLNLKLH